MKTIGLVSVILSLALLVGCADNANISDPLVEVIGEFVLDNPVRQKIELENGQPARLCFQLGKSKSGKTKIQVTQKPTDDNCMKVLADSLVLFQIDTAKTSISDSTGEHQILLNGTRIGTYFILSGTTHNLYSLCTQNDMYAGADLSQRCKYDIAEGLLKKISPK